MSASMDLSAFSTQPLAYKELNADSGTKTIVLVHGALASSDEWNTVGPHLAETYHLLLPDLPGHGKSRHVLPYSTELSARRVADLVRQHAIDGKAYVVGFSMGSHVAIYLASEYPDLVEALFISGFEVFSSTRMITNALWLQHHVPSLVPKSLLRWLMDGTDVQVSSTTAGSFSLCRSIAESMCFAHHQWPHPWPARTLIVAAGKSGLLPTADNPDDAKRLRDIASNAQPVGQTKAFTHPDMRHPWNIQAPELCARTARMWLEERGVPDGFEEL